MDKTDQSNEGPTDYIDIVNEINDFIASLDAPPLDNHTKELVGTADRLKFGQHGGDSSLTTSHDWSGVRSRHASGGDQNTSNQLCLARPYGDSSEDPSSGTKPFPVSPESCSGYGIYENRELGKPVDCDYSDCGVYSDVSSCCGGDVTDSDSGCYSHYQQPRSDVPSGYHLPVGYSSPSAYSTPSTSSSNVHQGDIRSLACTSNTSIPGQTKRQQHTRPQSPGRLSAEFHCEQDALDKRFHQVGSSAHTLAASAAGSQDWPRIDHDYQEPSNIPKIPSSPVPKRRSPVSHTFNENHSQSGNSLHPLSTSLHILSTSPSLTEPGRDGSYTVIKKQTPSNQSSLHKLGIKNRWPPGDVSNESSGRDLSTISGSQTNRNKGIVNMKEKQQEMCKESVQEKEQLALGSGKHNLAQVPVARVPDLSVLISELRSASPRSELSPTSNYTTTARSENVSPRKSETQPSTSRSDDHQPPYQEPVLSPGHRSRADYPRSGQTRSSPNQSPGVSSRSERQSPSQRLDPRTLSPTHRQPANGVAVRVPSPEHDYEPIENIQLVPIPARPLTKIPHPQGSAMAETGGQQPKHVKASHNFKGSNNDELCFKKGDIITVTQCVDGGWWEGTLNGRTGWFPSNYTKEVKPDIGYKNHKAGEMPVHKRESMQLYHNVVLKNVIETEKTHVSEMLRVLQSYIKPLEATHILTAPEYALLVGNVEEIIAFQQSFLAALEECERLPSAQRRIGGIFMQFAPRVKELYSSYCGNHPKAVSVLQKKREELGKFVESQGAPSPGAQTLTTILSKPFTRLDRYPSLLKELERHVEESHPDRGDTQRAIAVYRNIANSCMEIRKLKEMEFEIITSTIQGWEGEEIAKLGEVIHLSQVKLIMQTGDKYERIFVLFSSCLVMLSMSSRLSSYHYEGKIPLSGLTASPCESTENFQNAFDISGPMIEKITVLCGTKMEVSAWLDILNQQLSQTGNPVSSSKPQPLQVHMTPTCQTSVSMAVTPAKTAQISSNPPSAPPPQFPLSSKTSSVWSLTCLRPAPPLRPTLMCREEVLKSPRAGRKSTHKRKPDDPKVYNEDAFILQVIEAYCNSIKTRHTVNSSILDNPQVLLAEEEKIFDETEQQERTVVDTVYALQDRVKELEQEQRKLRLDLEEERRCRKKLEMLMRQHMIKSGVVDGGS